MRLLRIFLFTFVGGASPVALAADESSVMFDFNCECQDTSLRCSPSLTRADGAVFRSPAFGYISRDSASCQSHLLRVLSHSKQAFSLPAAHATAESYRLNFALLRSHEESCEKVSENGIMEGWRCVLETALVLRSSASENRVIGRQVNVPSDSAYEALPSDQPRWSASMTLLQVKSLVDQFSKKDALFNRASN